MRHYKKPLAILSALAILATYSTYIPHLVIPASSYNTLPVNSIGKGADSNSVTAPSEAPEQVDWNWFYQRKEGIEAKIFSGQAITDQSYIWYYKNLGVKLPGWKDEFDEMLGIDGTTDEEEEEEEEKNSILKDILDKMYVNPEAHFYPTVGNLFSLNHSSELYLNGNGNIWDTNGDGKWNDEDDGPHNPSEVDSWYKGKVRDISSVEGWDAKYQDVIEGKEPDYEGMSDEEKKKAEKEWKDRKEEYERLLALYSIDEDGGTNVAIEAFHNSPAIWQPTYEELPDIGQIIAANYSYAILSYDLWTGDSVSYVTAHDPRVKYSWPYAPRTHLSGYGGLDEDKLKEQAASAAYQWKEIPQWNLTERKGHIYLLKEGSSKDKDTDKDTEDTKEEKDVKSLTASDSPYVPYGEEDNYPNSVYECKGIDSIYMTSSYDYTRSDLADTGAEDSEDEDEDEDEENGNVLEYAQIGSEYFSAWNGGTWYKDTDIRVTTNSETENKSSTAVNLYPEASEDVARALNILGHDILLRDEYVTMWVNRDGSHSFGYYYDSVTDKFLNPIKSSSAHYITAPLTLDYLVQSLYSAMGMHYLGWSLYFFADPHKSIDFTTLAEKLNTDVIQVNEVQNRVDCFVSRVNLDKYWERAVIEGLVEEDGQLEYQIINPLKARDYGDTIKSTNVTKAVDEWYKEEKAKLDKDKKNKIIKKAEYDKKLNELKAKKKSRLEDSEVFNPNTAFIEYKTVPSFNSMINDMEQRLVEYKVDRARKQTLTLGEFCKLAKSFMHVYGEEVMTEQEQNILLLTYGAMLPYGIDDKEEFEAIKYLMAKGIVNADMAWSSPLQLDDFLIILSRIKDKSSRLTFKEVQITYDTFLLQQGFYPANLNFSNTPAASVTQVKMNKDYDIQKTEWVDFYLQQNTRVKLNDTTDEPETEESPPTEEADDACPLVCTQFGTTNADGVRTENMLNLHLELWSEEKEDDDNTVYSDYDHFRQLDYVYFGDGYCYLHVQVHKSVLGWTSDEEEDAKKKEDDKKKDDKKKEKSPSYINEEGMIKIVNDAESDVAYWEVANVGGVFMDPLAAVVSKDDSGKYKYKIQYYASTGQGLKDNRYATDKKVKPRNTRLNIIKVTADADTDEPSDTPVVKVKATDWDGLKEAYNIVPSQVYEQDDAGYVVSYVEYPEQAKLAYETEGLQVSSSHRTFDEINKEITYFDYQRYLAGYARMLEQHPYLSNNPEPTDTSEDATPNADDVCLSTGDMKPYSIVFEVSCGSDKNKLIGDLYWGSIDTGKKVVDKSRPKDVLLKTPDASTPIIEYVTFVNNKYIYSVNNISDANGVSDSLHIKQDDKDVLAASITGLVKEKNTFLIDYKTLLSLTNNMNAGGLQLFNGELYPVNDDSIIISYLCTPDDQLQHPYRATPFTIYISQSLHSVSVNNTIYKVPDDEILFYKQDIDGVVTYWINYRAAMGWPSGFSSNMYDTLTDADQEITVTIKDTSNFGWTYTQIHNVYTDYTDSIAVTTILGQKGHFLPLTAPFITSNFIFYNSGDDGLYLIVTKNSDTFCYEDPSQSIIGGMSEKTKQRYNRYQEFVLHTLGAYFGTGDTVVSDYIYCVYDVNDVDLRLDDQDTKASDTSEKKKQSEESTYVTKPCLYLDKSRNCLLYQIPQVNTKGHVRYYASTDFYKKYYTEEVLLPIFESDGTLYNMQSNMLKGCPYGTTLSYAISNYSSDKDQKTISAINWKDDDTYETYSREFNSGILTCPVGVIYNIMATEYKMDENPAIASNILYYGYYGNYWTTLRKESNGSINVVPVTNNSNIQSLPNAETFQILSKASNRIWLNTNSTYISATEARRQWADAARRGDLVDAQDVEVFDWDRFKFSSLIKHTDSALSVILILVLNVLPRFAIFICILLLGLATIANIKPWQKFCNNVFDPYKLLTFGSATVETIQVKWLIISSIIGLGIFALFTDGTIINVFVWITRAVTGIIER